MCAMDFKSGAFVLTNLQELYSSTSLISMNVSMKITCIQKTKLRHSQQMGIPDIEII